MGAREWLVVASLPGMGPLRIAELAAREPKWPQGWLAGMPQKAAQALRLWLEHPARSPLRDILEYTQAWLDGAPGRHLLHPDHPDWPTLLRQLPDPPAVLWVQGDLQALNSPTLVVVGTRRPTQEGVDNARAFARELSRRGWCIVSGMALGVDGIAQQAALDAGGASVAVLGCGTDVIYPPRHRELHQRLTETPGGLLLSEHPPGTRARPAFFPRRNRIVTGLSLGVLVVEAAEKSGSLVSARLALEQDRELFALPGSIHNVQARGCLNLIREGHAHLVRDAQDILGELGHWASSFLPSDALMAIDTTDPLLTTAPSAPSENPTTGMEGPLPDDLLRWLSASPTPNDALVQASDVSVSDCQQRLLMLELDGWVTQQAGGWVRLPPA
ncbi:DNA-processing protein DprA [Vreelandella rituensis]|uniref:DNA-protecting protein DprA n=1 Tax=Vreelandella rituensis TaxID=2282306 RepID=A0A368U7S0_9GAMM|nr:DNA-processing protein DprA [Halomonas rituensis]RCV92536.1 DNA-protecting protein DprA [Halomonas rituensis]